MKSPLLRRNNSTNGCVPKQQNGARSSATTISPRNSTQWHGMAFAPSAGGAYTQTKSGIHYAENLGTQEFDQRAKGAVGVRRAGTAVYPRRRRHGVWREQHTRIQGDESQRPGATARSRRIYPVGITRHCALSRTAQWTRCVVACGCTGRSRCPPLDGVVQHYAVAES